MAEQIFEVLRGYLIQYGYGTVAVVLMLENAGLPVPGETILLLASFLAYSEHRLQLPYIILVGVIAATLGDNLGFALGYYGGRPLLDRYQRTFRISHSVIERGEELFRKYGAFTIFVARFIAGMRIVAGPLAGVLRMDWRKFLLFNFLGAALWVSVISLAGYLFGQHWERLFRLLHEVSIGLLVAGTVAIAWLWYRRRKRG
ncbi:MAG TPA: DedA family protein [Terriglobales bacterium]|nr:DedA family protein [Terriglobales bacterium]